MAGFMEVFQHVPICAMLTANQILMYYTIIVISMMNITIFCKLDRI